MKNILNIFLLFFVALSMACATSAPQKKSSAKSQTPTTTAVVAQNQTSDQTAASAGLNSPVAMPSSAVKSNDSAAPPQQIAGKTAASASSSAEIKAKQEVVIADYNAIKPGMSYEDVVKILGSNGEKSGDYKTENGSMQLYKWMGKGANGDWILSARFDNGKLTDKSQFGLK